MPSRFQPTPVLFAFETRPCGGSFFAHRNDRMPYVVNEIIEMFAELRERIAKRASEWWDRRANDAGVFLVNILDAIERFLVLALMRMANP
jgi:hypothetical protein